MSNIAIIGAGGLGSRHLQSVAQMKRDICIQVVDVSRDSLEKSAVLYNQVTHDFVSKVEFFEDIASLSTNLDAVIIATTSKPRLHILETLLSQKKVKNIVLEKFLFPSIADYDEAEKLLSAHGCNVWVNCPRREWTSYDKIRQLFINEKLLQVSVCGSNWGLGCNSIHFLDLISFLTGKTNDVTWDISRLDCGTTASKRSGYIEFSGTLLGQFNNGSNFTLTSHSTGQLPVVIELLSDQARCIVFEYCQRVFISTASNNWTIDECTFDTPYQSQITGRIINDILDTGACKLPTYIESSAMHKPLLTAFLKHVNINKNDEVTECLIT